MDCDFKRGSSFASWAYRTYQSPTKWSPLARGFGRCALCPPLPHGHAFTNVHAAVINEAGSDHKVPYGFKNVCQRRAEAAIPEVTQVERFVGVRRHVLDHNAPRTCYEFSVPWPGRFQLPPGTRPSGKADINIRAYLLSFCHKVMRTNRLGYPLGEFSRVLSDRFAMGAQLKAKSPNVGFGVRRSSTSGASGGQTVTSSFIGR